MPTRTPSLIFLQAMRLLTTHCILGNVTGAGLRTEVGILFFVSPPWHRTFLTDGCACWFNGKMTVFRKEYTLNGLPNEWGSAIY